ncbi:MAG: 1-deoxy-D-xylulose-5-phosphate synthase [Candidatus Izemoplasmatales bacterium]
MIDVRGIKDPAFLKTASIGELRELASAIRVFLIENVAETGGHLSSNLGVVELTIALHRVFDSPKDKLIFDVGHQAYVHKILTGRAPQFPTLRRFGGLSGFLKRSESIHDVWEAGHSSTALAAAAGFETARVSRGETWKTVALVGDGSLNSGLSFEALNFLGQRHDLAPIIVLNDNAMSISKNVGTFAKLLTSMRSSRSYRTAVRKSRRLPRFLHVWKERFGMMLRQLASNTTIFDDLGFKYFGPIDGHDLKSLVRHLEMVKRLNTACVLHVVTKKGRGYRPAEEDRLGLWHGVRPFDPYTGLPKSKKAENLRSWSSIVSGWLLDRADAGDDFRVVVPAMVAGSDLFEFQERHPGKLIDVGICESFAACFSAALAQNGIPVFAPIYSSFLQRAYDQVNHDVARQNLHVVFGIDRAGLVGEDGDTHQGVFDVAYLGHLPNVAILQPADADEMRLLLDYAFDVATGPVAVRYSNASVERPKTTTGAPVLVPSWRKLSEGGAVNLVCYGDNVRRMAALIAADGLSVNLYDARFLKPLDLDAVREIFTSGLPTLVLEDVVETGGLGTMMVRAALAESQSIDRFTILGIPDRFVEHGRSDDLRRSLSLDDASIRERILSMITPNRP